jgi:branched-chain amino acid transport system permease protein
MQWLDALIQGVLLGGMYAQYALGMALMFGVMRIVNITHGDLVILLALIGISLATSWHIGPFVALIVLVPLAAFFGWALQRAC